MPSTLAFGLAWPGVCLSVAFCQYRNRRKSAPWDCECFAFEASMRAPADPSSDHHTGLATRWKQLLRIQNSQHPFLPGLTIFNNPKASSRLFWLDGSAKRSRETSSNLPLRVLIMAGVLSCATREYSDRTLPLHSESHSSMFPELIVLKSR